MAATPYAMQSVYNQNRSSTSNSPFTSGNMKPSGTGSPYLPGYLLGNINSPGPSSYGRSLSSGGYQNTSSSRLNTRTSPHKHSSTLPYMSPSDRKQQRMSPLSSQHSVTKDKLGAPPTESLFSTISHEANLETDMPSRRTQMFGVHQSGDSFLTPNRSPQNALSNSVFSPRQETVIPQSPAQMDPFYSQGDGITSEDVLDDTAVTVFGFPPAASSYILQQFSQYGTIEKYEMHNTGNWLHLKYQTKIQAKKASSKNGKIFARSIMIGVCPCIKKEIASMEAEFNASSMAVQDTPKQLLHNQKPTTIRPLSSSSGTPIRNAAAGSDLFSNDKDTPQKKDGVVAKALDYVFGW